MKKLLFILVTMLLPTMASADAVEINGIYYNLNAERNEAEVTKNPSVYTGIINIPETVIYEGKKYSVTSIGDRAFFGCSGLTSVTISNSVTSIGIFAFRECTGLTSITIPNSVTSIGDCAFYNCSGLTSISISNSVTSIGSSVFNDCYGLTSVTIPNSVTSIGSSAFEGCTGLTSIKIPNSVTNIGYAAFEGCRGLTSVSIPNSVTSIEDRTFYGCSGLTSITIPNSIKSIGFRTFANCTGLTSITISNSLTSIGSRAFERCTALKSVTIPNSVTSIEDYAFTNCTSLTSISISNSLRSIGNSTFSDCTGLTSVTIPNSVTSIGVWAFANCTNLTSVTIPNSVTSIGSSAFMSCRSLTAVHITDLDAWCKIQFDNGANPLLYAGHLYLNNQEITELKIPDGVTSIKSQAFKDCTSLTSVTIPNSVTSIGTYAFSGCSGLTSITIPNSVTSIGDNAFYGCSGLTSISIPNSVTSIGRSAFEGCTGLTSIMIPNSVTEIGSSAFSGCSGLTSITIPNSVTSIGGSAFQSCTGLTSITIPNSVTNIYTHAFAGCSGLISVTIPSSVISIGSNAFIGCSNLSMVNITDISAWLKVKFSSIYSNPLSYAQHLFIKDNELQNLVIPNNVSSVGDYAFSGCSNIKSLTIPESVLSIGSYAFRNCSGLTALSLPESLPTLGIGAFSGCNSEILPENIRNIGTRTIHVETAGTLGKYISADEKYSIEKLILSGELNGTDIHLIRDMAGIDTDKMKNDYQYDADYTDTKGNLRVLDLSDARIVEGGVFMSWLLSRMNDSWEYSWASTDVISERMFERCYRLEELILPKTAIEIHTPLLIMLRRGDTTESYDDKNKILKIVRVADGNPYYDSRDNCNGIIEKSTMTFIAGGSNSTIPNGVVSIGEGAFQDCVELTSVSIPSSVTSIGNSAFGNCSGLKDLYCWADNIPNIDSKANPFYKVNLNQITLHVPSKSIEAYKSAEPWKNFKEIVAIGPQCGKPEISFVDGKISFSSETSGVTYNYTITNNDIKSGSGQEVKLGMTYLVSVYATKDGYEKSDVASREITITGSGQAVLVGDVNSDGVVNVADHVKLTQIIMKK